MQPRRRPLRDPVPDFPKAYVAPGGAITADDFEAWEQHAGVRIHPGEIVLVRSGRWSAPALAANVERSAGIHPGTAEWLNARGVAALGDEAGTDTVADIR